MTDQDLLLEIPGLQFGSGVIGVCDVCGKRQAVIVLSKERFQLCVLDFLNKSWVKSPAKPGAPLPPYRSERVWFPTASTKEGKAPAIVLSPTKVVRHPLVLVCPDIFGLTTALLDGAIRFAREGFEVLLPDVGKTSSVGPQDHLTLRWGVRTGGGVPLDSPRIGRLVDLYGDALAYLRKRDMVDPEKTALFGASYGGSLAVALAARETRLSAIVLAYPKPVRPPERLRLITAPVLFLYGNSDPTSLRARRQFESHLDATRSVVEFVAYPGAKSGFLGRDLSAYRMDPAEAAWARAAAFLRQKLMPPPPKPPPPRAAAPTAPPAARPPPNPASPTRSSGSSASVPAPGPVPISPATGAPLAPGPAQPTLP